MIDSSGRRMKRKSKSMNKTAISDVNHIFIVLEYVFYYVKWYTVFSEEYTALFVRYKLGESYSLHHDASFSSALCYNGQMVEDRTTHWPSLKDIRWDRDYGCT
jgi:hypothetical protein